MAQIERQQTVLKILQNLRDLGGLKKLFWEELNYERENKPLSVRGWPDSARKALVDDPILFASGGEDNAFHVIYCYLASNSLQRSLERPIVNQLMREHPYCLFVFSDKTQSAWHFLNVKYDEKAEKRRLFRRITVRANAGLRTATERLQMVDLALMGKELFGIPALEIQKRHDDAFDVESVTKEFYKELANWYFWAREHAVFPKDAEPDADGKPSVHLIRLITRLIFCWFLREKRNPQTGEGLLPNAVFDPRRIKKLGAAGMAHVIFCRAAKRQISRKDCYHSKKDPDCQNCKHLKENIKPSGHITSSPEDHREKQKTKMKMNGRNRLMATERCPEFIKDREQYHKLLKEEINGPFSKEAKAFHEKLCRKWDINGLYLYCDFDGVTGHGSQVEVWDRPAIDQVSDAEWAHIQGSISGFVPGPPYAEAPYTMTEGDRLFVQIAIDLSRNDEDLEKSFSQKIKGWKRQHYARNKRLLAAREEREHQRPRGSENRLKKNTTPLLIGTERKPKKTEYDPWDVYNFYHRDGLPLLEIARRLSGQKSIPPYNTWPPYKRVRLAHRRAKEMIRIVAAEARMREAYIHVSKNSLRQISDSVFDSLRKRPDLSKRPKRPMNK